MKITIMRDQLIASLCTAAKDDVRYYLNGVYLEATNMETRLTSTDGHIMSLQRADAKGENDVEGVVRMIVPSTAIEKIKNHKYLRTVEINDDGGKWCVVDGSTRTYFDPVEGTFPECRRVIPAAPSGVVAQFDPRLVMRFAKAAIALGVTGKKGIPLVAITHNGGSSALVSLGRDTEYLGIMMPMRESAVALVMAPPAWATAALEAIEEPA